jgi:hypothetical protein
VRDFAEFCRSSEWEKVIQGSFPNELNALGRNADAIVASLQALSLQSMRCRL